MTRIRCAGNINLHFKLTHYRIFGLSFAVTAILWAEGARRITAAESGLLGGAETPFAMVFAWVFLTEIPPLTTMIGGAVVLAAVFWQAFRDAGVVNSSAR